MAGFKIHTKTDKTKKVLDQLERNMPKALDAIGAAAQKAIKDTMLSTYYRPVYRTGNLYRSIEHAPYDKKREQVGTNVKYAPYVHEGTSRMAGRPYIKDGIMQNSAEIFTAGANELQEGLK